jgi:hypothetical protein
VRAWQRAALAATPCGRDSLALLSSLFFGTAIAVALVWPLAIGLLLPRTLSDRRGIAGVVAPTLTVVMVYVLLQSAAARIYSAPLTPVTLVRWSLDEPAVVTMTFLHLVRVGVASLLLGTWCPPGRPDWLSWFTFAIAACGGVGAFVVARPRDRATMVAFLLLALAGYALVAVARGPVTARLFGTSAEDVGATPRYQYTAQAFVAVASCIAIAAMTARAGPVGMLSPAVVWGALVVAGAFVRGATVDLHDRERVIATGAIDALTRQVAAGEPGETVYVSNVPVPIFGWMPTALYPPPGLVALFVLTSRRDELDGRQVRFIERDPSISGPFLRRASRTARLLVSSAPPPGSPAGVP